MWQRRTNWQQHTICRNLTVSSGFSSYVPQRKRQHSLHLGTELNIYICIYMVISSRLWIWSVSGWVPFFNVTLYFFNVRLQFSNIGHIFLIWSTFFQYWKNMIPCWKNIIQWWKNNDEKIRNRTGPDAGRNPFPYLV